MQRSSNGTSALDSTDWLQDLELMHHWSKRTSHTQLGGGAHTEHVWGEFVPREAVKHRFLMHGVLAIASLHIASTAPTDALKEKYLFVHDKHQATALESSRVIMANLNDDSAAALFAFSSITSLSSISQAVIRAQSTPEPRRVSIDELCKCLALTRGVREIVAASIQALLQSPMRALLTGYELHCDVRVLLPGHIVDKISLLQRMLSERCDDKDQHAMCSNAVVSLQQIYRNIFFFLSKDCLGVGHIWRWTAMVDTGFIHLIQSCYQPALVITSFFVICCQFVRAEWFMQDWGRYSFEALSAGLSEEYQQYLAWPREQLATDCADFRQGDASIEYLNPDTVDDNPEKAVYRTMFPQNVPIP
ncbi:hypothetical protein AMS68_007064 [Peltaster fructicola]|uniref:Transcription factor domain-containing protein n=1 Tax=Peltaster fructicola TaxID=286661 RepID=A0A6H0Y3F7_9PEZI|nr:hypothetical protein AMS68_007064 [Peltaster fructicola]